MSKRILILVIVAGLLALVGCDALQTNDSKDDPAAAQQFFPTFAGYSIQETGGVQDTIVATLGGAALLTANPIQALLVERIDTLLDCYRERGAMDAKIYIENLTSVTEARVPVAGVLAVINTNRAVDNLLGCLLSGPRAFATDMDPCSGSGSFNFEGDTILYIYAATDTPLCNLFDAHFATYTGGSTR